MNNNRYLISVIAGFVFVFIYEFIVHGFLLIPTYAMTPYLWRGQDEMLSLFPISVSVQFIMVAVLCFIFTRHYEDKGIKEGIRFGTMIGLLMGIGSFGMYTYMPISFTLALSWFASILIETIGLGILFAKLYKDKK